MSKTAAAHRLVLTSAADLGDDAVATIAERVRAAGLEPDAPRRLAAGAVEIGCAVAPPDGMAAADLTGGRPIDVNAAGPAGAARLFIADMDSTMIAVECIDELADFAGMKDRVAAITERAMQGELDFEGALLERVALLRGLPEADLAACYAQRVALNPGARTLVQTMNAMGAVTALVSGGFTYFSQRVAEAAGFGLNRANVLLFEDGRLTGDVARPILGRAAKLELLQSLCAEHGIAAADVVAVGDGANDLSMVEAAGIGIAYHAKPALRAAARAVLDHSDLTAILALQGLPRSEWCD